MNPEQEAIDWFEDNKDMFLMFGKREIAVLAYLKGQASGVKEANKLLRESQEKN